MSFRLMSKICFNNLLKHNFKNIFNLNSSILALLPRESLPMNNINSWLKINQTFFHLILFRFPAFAYPKYTGLSFSLSFSYSRSILIANSNYFKPLVLIHYSHSDVVAWLETASYVCVRIGYLKSFSGL